MGPVVCEIGCGQKHVHGAGAWFSAGLHLAEITMKGLENSVLPMLHLWHVLASTLFAMCVTQCSEKSEAGLSHLHGKDAA